MSFTFTNPPLNPLTLKARKVTFSLASQHGRVFLMSAVNFMFSFAAWVSSLYSASDAALDIRHFTENRLR